jgi:hypothetical protein
LNEQFLIPQTRHDTASNEQANASVFFIFCQRTIFLIQFFANAKKHTFIFLPSTKPNAKKMKECFSPTLLEIPLHKILPLKTQDAIQ